MRGEEVMGEKGGMRGGGGGGGEEVMGERGGDHGGEGRDERGGMRAIHYNQIHFPVRNERAMQV